MNKTNTARANRGKAAMKAHRESMGEEPTYDAMDLASMLADLRHTADLEGFDFHHALDMSYAHYLEELHGADNYLDDEETKP